MFKISVEKASWRQVMNNRKKIMLNWKEVVAELKEKTQQAGDICVNLAWTFSKPKQPKIHSPEGTKDKMLLAISYT